MQPDPEPDPVPDQGGPTGLNPLATLVGAAVAIAGAIGPWRLIDAAGQDTLSLGGTQFDGFVVIVCAVAAGVVALAAGRGPAVRNVPPLLGGVIVLLALNAVVRTLVDEYGPGFDTATGWGVWATLAGGAIVAVDGVRRR